MRFRDRGALALSCFLAGCAPRGDAVSSGSLMPAEASGYRAAGSDHDYDRKTIFEYIDGAGEVYLQFAYRTVRVRDFGRQGQPGISVQLFDMGRADDAFGIFSLDREDDDAGIGQDSEYGGGLLRFWKGRFFVCVSAENETPESKAAVLALGRAVAGGIADDGERPEVLDGLPPEGLLARRVRFFHGPFGLASHYPAVDGKAIGLSQETDAVLAAYRKGDSVARLLLVRYPDAGRAAAGLEALSRPGVSPAGTDRMAPGTGEKWAGARRAGRTVVAVFEAVSREDLDDLLARSAGRLEGASWAR